jgi:hypothetical protein
MDFLSFNQAFIFLNIPFSCPNVKNVFPTLKEEGRGSGRFYTSGIVSEFPFMTFSIHCLILELRLLKRNPVYIETLNQSSSDTRKS